MCATNNNCLRLYLICTNICYLIVFNNSEIVKWAFWGAQVIYYDLYTWKKKWRKKSFKILILPPNAVAKAKLSNILKQSIGDKLKWEYVV